MPEYIRRDKPHPCWKIANRPMDSVCWYDAVAFCRRLTVKLRSADLLEASEVIRLPAEWEWQQAATGGELDRTFPWGSDDGQAGRANTRESGLERTTAVGMYPSGKSPPGALDLAGNVLEWCRNTYREPAEPDPDDRDLAGTGERVLRGGSWGSVLGGARCAARRNLYPVFRADRRGFRLVRWSLISS